MLSGITYPEQSYERRNPEAIARSLAYQPVWHRGLIPDRMTIENLCSSAQLLVASLLISGIAVKAFKNLG